MPTVDVSQVHHFAMLIDQISRVVVKLLFSDGFPTV